MLRSVKLTDCVLLSSDVLIGAPRANTSSDGIVERGAVFTCPWRSSTCQRVEFDSSGTEEKSWLWNYGRTGVKGLVQHLLGFSWEEPDLGADAAELCCF